VCILRYAGGNIWDKGRTVLTRTHYWFQHEPCWYVRKKNAPKQPRAAAAPSSADRDALVLFFD
jgi:hypothetical protein